MGARGNTTVLVTFIVTALICRTNARTTGREDLRPQDKTSSQPRDKAKGRFADEKETGVTLISNEGKRIQLRQSAVSLSSRLVKMAKGEKVNDPGKLDPYSLLGLTKLTDATWREVKRIYRKLALLLHPDKGGDNSVMKIFNAAYDTLTSWFKSRKSEEESEDKDPDDQWYDQWTDADFERYTWSGWNRHEYKEDDWDRWHDDYWYEDEDDDWYDDEWYGEHNHHDYKQRTQKIPQEFVSGEIRFSENDAFASTSTLEAIAEYLNHHNGVQPEIIDLPPKTMDITETIQDRWDREFISSRNQVDTFKLMIAAHYMGLPSLKNLAAAKIAICVQTKKC